MPRFWRSSSWEPNGVQSTTPPFSGAVSQPQLVSDLPRPPPGFSTANIAGRPSFPSSKHPGESSWSRLVPDISSNRSAWYQSFSRTSAPPSDPSRAFRMDPPVSDGSEAQTWVTRVQYFFDHILMLEEQRLHHVVMLFAPPAADWIFSYRANNPHVSWLQFLEDVRRRFDPQYFMNHIELLAKLTQSGSLSHYHQEFESMLNRVQGIPESTLVPIYLGGLRQPLKNQVRFQHPISVAAAMAIATEYDSVAERSVVRSRRPWTTRDSRSPIPPSLAAPPEISKPTATTPTLSRPRDLSKLPIVCVSSAEKSERSRLGLCWYCSEKWVPAHTCKEAFLAYMGEDEDESELEANDEAVLNLEAVTADLSHMYAMDGKPRAASLVLQGFLGTSKVLILVD